MGVIFAATGLFNSYTTYKFAKSIINFYNGALDELDHIENQIVETTNEAKEYINILNEFNNIGRFYSWDKLEQDILQNERYEEMKVMQEAKKNITTYRLVLDTNTNTFKLIHKNDLPK